MTALPELRSALVDAAELQQQHAAANQSMTRTRGIARRRWWLWRGVPAVLLFVLGGTAVAFASGLVSFGAPHSRRRSSPIRGRNWGRSRRGRCGCCRSPPRTRRVGRRGACGCSPRPGGSVASRSGACSTANSACSDRTTRSATTAAFTNWPSAGTFDRFACAALDGKGHIFNNVTRRPTRQRRGSGGLSAAVPRRAAPAERAATSRPAKRTLCTQPPPSCPQSDERNLYYGLLGPDARSITYTLEAGAIR